METKLSGIPKSLVITLFSILFLFASGASAEQKLVSGSTVSVVTDSPRETVSTLQRLSGEFEAAFNVYLGNQDRSHAARVYLFAEQIISLIDLSQFPTASGEKIGGETAAYLLDIFGRIGFPDLDDIPDSSGAQAAAPGSYAIPQTPFRIVQINEGDREGEFLFSSSTVRLAPRFHQVVQQMPLLSGQGQESWSNAIRQITGPMIPMTLVNRLPDWAKTTAADAPIWKIIVIATLIFLTTLILYAFHHIAINKFGSNGWLRLLTPLAVLGMTLALQRFISFQINITGEFSELVDVLRVTVIYIALASAFWIVCVEAANSIVSGPRFSAGSIDASMLQLLARIIAVFAGIVILANGAQELGLPVFSILAGLGIGGLAVALAIRPTLENLISGFILYLDRPIRVGDFCTFGGQSGTVEAIGVRSTQIRALDRTRISIPNSQFADMQIVNWAQCDQMMIKHVIGLRYETSTDQLRYVLAEIRKLMHGHPRIDNETIRVRLIDFGGSSLDIEIRVYARTREWNDFFAIREDLLLRIKDIVETSGTGFAFSSQTLYLGKDEGLDEELSQKSEEAVARWRIGKKLPFPHFSPDITEKLNDKLDYPPRGSSEYNLGNEEEMEHREELLSATPVDADDNNPLEKKTD